MKVIAVFCFYCFFSSLVTMASEPDLLTSTSTEEVLTEDEMDEEKEVNQAKKYQEKSTELEDEE